jgi:PEP-CTERM motif
MRIAVRLSTGILGLAGPPWLTSASAATIITRSVDSIPEPGTLFLLGAGLLLLGLIRWRRR